MKNVRSSKAPHTVWKTFKCKNFNHRNKIDNSKYERNRNDDKINILSRFNDLVQFEYSIFSISSFSFRFDGFFYRHYFLFVIKFSTFFVLLKSTHIYYTADDDLPKKSLYTSNGNFRKLSPSLHMHIIHNLLW